MNAISYDSAYGMIQAALDAGVNLAEVYVDTVGDAAQYTQRHARQLSRALLLAGTHAAACPRRFPRSRGF